uniref:PfkB family carbohydrate kinase n=1 Tax=Latilactobacillus sakei TaxID=1599 RepID=UPI001179C077
RDSSKIDTLMTTDKELAMLTNSSVTDAKTAEKSAKKLLKKGIEHIYVLMPHTGLFYIDNRNTKLIAGIPIKRINNNGASAALTAAVVDSRLNNLGWEKTTQIAYTAALICMESAKSVNPLLSKDYLLKTVTRYLES